MDSSGGGAWCPSGTINNGIPGSASGSSLEYLEIDLGRMVVVKHVLTQGRYAKGRGQEYAEAYTLHYWRPGMDEFKAYRDSMGRAVSVLKLAKTLLKDIRVLSFGLNFGALTNAALSWQGRRR